MKVFFANETYDCAKAVRTEEKATLYLEDGGKVDFIGVSDWSAFTVEGGEWEKPEPTEEDDMNAMLVDHELRIMDLELGISEEEV